VNRHALWRRSPCQSRNNPRRGSCPKPTRQLRPNRRPRAQSARLQIFRANPIREPGQKIRIHIAVIVSSHADPASSSGSILMRQIRAPARHIFLFVLGSHTSIGVMPGSSTALCIRAKVDGEEHRRRLRRRSRQINQQVNLRPDGSFENEIVTCLRTALPLSAGVPLSVKSKLSFRRTSRIAPITARSQKSPQFQTPFRPPRLRILHALAIAQRQRVNQCILAHLRLVVVHGNPATTEGGGCGSARRSRSPGSRRRCRSGRSRRRLRLRRGGRLGSRLRAESSRQQSEFSSLAWGCLLDTRKSAQFGNETNCSSER